MLAISLEPTFGREGVDADGAGMDPAAQQLFRAWRLAADEPDKDSQLAEQVCAVLPRLLNSRVVTRLVACAVCCCCVQTLGALDSADNRLKPLLDCGLSRIGVVALKDTRGDWPFESHSHVTRRATGYAP